MRQAKCDASSPRRPLIRAAAALAVLAQLVGVLPGAVALPVIPRIDDLAAPGAGLQASAVEAAAAPVKTVPARAAKLVAALTGAIARTVGPGDGLMIVADGRDAVATKIGRCPLRPAQERIAAAGPAFRPSPTGPPHTA